MNISYSWLRDLAPTISATPRDVADRLALLGAPVDELTEVAEGLHGVQVARVDAVRPHPNADRLRVCTVDNGGPEPLQVVCGAANVEAGGFYPLAPVGSALPGGMVIKRAKLRGEVSEGMLCSARELGLGRDHAGLLALAGDDWTPGERLIDAIGLAGDARLLVDVTPNRPDLLSHLGVARELAPQGVADLVLRPFAEVDLRVERGGATGEVAGVRVAIDDVQGCTRYLAAVVRGVRIAPSPEWLATRLRVIGLRPINNVVDATNYVLHEVGQPLHAFDLARLRGGEVRVRRAAQGETLRTLDATDRALLPADLVIADAAGPIAVAGVMGGADSEVVDTTVDLLIECAHFEPGSTRRTARRLGLSTDASYRFERGVDRDGMERALHRVVELLVATAGGEPVVEVLDLQATMPETPTVSLRHATVSRMLGVEVPASEVAALLTAIGFTVDEQGDTLQIGVPGFRPDVREEADVVEEIARRRGYDSFPEVLGPFRPTAVPEDPGVAVARSAHALLVRHGFREARTAPFAPAAEGRVPVLNPLSQEESSLRDRLVPGLLRRLEHNFARQIADARLYELGTVFLPSGGPRPDEQRRLGAVWTGRSRPAHWTGPSPAYDVWDCRALLESWVAELAPGARLDVAPVGPDRFALHGDDQWIGEAGRVPPEQIDAPVWAGPVWMMEVLLPGARKGGAAAYRALPTHPAVERDLALLVPASVSAAEVAAVLREGGGPLLEGTEVFDRFVGGSLPDGIRSLAWRLRFRAADRTLSDGEVDAAETRVLALLEERVAVRRR